VAGLLATSTASRSSTTASVTPRETVVAPGPSSDRRAVRPDDTTPASAATSSRPVRGICAVTTPVGSRIAQRQHARAAFQPLRPPGDEDRVIIGIMSRSSDRARQRRYLSGQCLRSYLPKHDRLPARVAGAAYAPGLPALLPLRIAAYCLYGRSRLLRPSTRRLEAALGGLADVGLPRTCPWHRTRRDPAGTNRLGRRRQQPPGRLQRHARLNARSRRPSERRQSDFALLAASRISCPAVRHCCNGPARRLLAGHLRRRALPSDGAIHMTAHRSFGVSGRWRLTGGGWVETMVDTTWSGRGALADRWWLAHHPTADRPPASRWWAAAELSPKAHLRPRVRERRGPAVISADGGATLYN